MHRRPTAVFVTTLLLAALPMLSRATQATTTADSKPAATAEASRYTVEPTPAWVQPFTGGGGTSPSAPMYYRLIDNQVQLGDGSTSQYTHVVRHINAAAGLSSAAQIEIQFDPSYQSLVLHHIDIVRGGRHYNRLDRKRIQLLQRETQLERRMYDGRITASIVLEDVRVGDEVDYDYSIRGANPVFGGRFLDVDFVGSPYGPTMNYRYRLLAPVSRAIAYRAGPAVQLSESLHQGLRDTQYLLRDLPQLQLDPGADADQLLKSQIWLSEYRSWSEVVTWGQSLFTEPQQSMPRLEAQAELIRRQGATPEARLLAALRFVQTDIRYFGTEIGLGSHRPASPEKVLEQRFGDCKDKTALLVALAHRLGLQAAPVLVSTQLRGRTADVLPSPMAFDHAIAQVQLDGVSYWLDSTRAYQTGTLANRQTLGLDRGLVLQAGATALLDLPRAYGRRFVTVTDNFKIEHFAEGAVLQSRITYRGDFAEVMRESVADAGSARVETALNEAYVRLYPSIRTAAPMRIEESDTDNELSFVQQFRIPDFWSFPEERALKADLGFWSIAQTLRVPNAQSRNDSYAIHNPGIYEHRISIDYPEDVFSAADTSQHFDDGDTHFALHTEVKSTRSHVEYAGQLRWLAQAVTPSEWTAYTAKLSRLWPQLGWSTTVSAIAQNQLPAVTKELQAAENDLRSGRLHLVTSTQRESLARSIVLSWKLKGGRLSPQQQAQTLRQRGIDYDNLNRVNEAAADFQAALNLAPESAEIMESAAVNAMARNDLPGAVTLTSRVIAARPADSEARRTRAQAYYLMSNYSSARDDLQELLRDSTQLRGGYSLIMLALATRHAGGDAAGALQPYLGGELPEDWPRPLIDWLRGETDDAAVLRAAGAGQEAPGHLCEAYFYMAERYRAEGNMVMARDYLHKSQAQGVTEYFEYFASSLELQGIGAM